MRFRRVRSDTAQHAGGLDQRAGFQLVHGEQNVRRSVFFFKSQIQILAAHHTVHTGQKRKLPYRAQRRGRRNAPLGRRKREQIKRVRQQRIARQNGVGLAEFSMGGKLPAAKIVVVHTGQIVVDQRIGMHVFHRSGKEQRGLRIAAAKTAERQAQQRADALAAAL